MDIPSSLNAWDLNLLEQLAKENHPESDRHDYKSNLPSGRDLTKLACAFANTDGGFIVLGMSEGNGKIALTGMKPDKELGKKLHDKLKTTPSLSLSTPKRIGLDSNGSVAYVVHVPESNHKPHSPTLEKDRIFWKRVTGTCQKMTRKEVKLQFEQTEQRIRRVHLALRDIQDYLSTIDTEAKHNKTRRTNPGEVKAFINRPPTDAATTLTEDLQALLDMHLQTLRYLQTIRKHLRWIDSKIDLTIARTQPGTNNTLFSSHNTEIRERGGILVDQAYKLKAMVESRDERLVPEDVSFEFRNLAP